MSPEVQAIMELVAQVRDLTAGIAQQQQTAMEVMLNSERGRPAAQAQGITEKYYKRVESFNGEPVWRDWSFQFKSATMFTSLHQTVANLCQSSDSVLDQSVVLVLISVHYTSCMCTCN